MNTRFPLIALAGLLGCALSASAQAADRPNVLLIIADDMAHADLGAAGHPLLKTPNLDRLARDGVRFTHAFTPNPICTPSRAAILTGQDCFTNGCYFVGMPMKDSSVHFAQLCSRAGYDTFISGKWHNMASPWERGFSNEQSILVRGGNHTMLRVTKFGSNQREQQEGFSTTNISDAAVAFLDRYEGDKPFLAYVSYTAPHDPWTPPGKYAEMYPVRGIDLPPNFMPEPGYKWFTEWHGTQLRDEALMPFPRTPEGVRDVRSRYFGMVTQMDHQIGRILDKLREKRLEDNTLVVFVADHGISLGAHGFSGKQTMYEEGIRLPMIVRHPGLKRGAAVRDELVSLIDVFPTVCQAAGIEIPRSVEGKSLLGLYQGKSDWPRKQIFAAFQSPEKHRMIARTVRGERYKYIHNLLTDEVELYDLADDPHELKNLAGQPAHARLEKQLADDLSAWRRRMEPADLPTGGL